MSLAGTLGDKERGRPLDPLLTEGGLPDAGPQGLLGALVWSTPNQAGMQPR